MAPLNHPRFTCHSHVTLKFFFVLSMILSRINLDRSVFEVTVLPEKTDSISAIFADAAQSPLGLTSINDRTSQFVGMEKLDGKNGR